MAKRRVTFSDGRTVTFGNRRKSPVRQLPYVFAKGAKIEAPPGLAHGELFQAGRRVYVVFNYTNDAGHQIRYGQPVNV